MRLCVCVRVRDRGDRGDREVLVEIVETVDSRKGGWGCLQPN